MSSNFKITIFTLVVMLGVAFISLMTTDTGKTTTIKPNSAEVVESKTDINSSQTK